MARPGEGHKWATAAWSLGATPHPSLSSSSTAGLSQLVRHLEQTMSRWGREAHPFLGRVTARQTLILSRVGFNREISCQKLNLAFGVPLVSPFTQPY